MADDEGKTDDDGGEGDKGADTFDPKSLSKEAQEYIRRNIQSDSDAKAALVETNERESMMCPRVDLKLPGGARRHVATRGVF